VPTATRWEHEEVRLCSEVELNLAYRWFCRLGLEGRDTAIQTDGRLSHARKPHPQTPSKQNPPGHQAEAAKKTSLLVTADSEDPVSAEFFSILSDASYVVGAKIRRAEEMLANTKSRLSTSFAVATALALATPVGAQSNDQRIQELQRMIEAQQAQIAAQAKLLEQMQREMQAISQETQADAAAAAQSAAQAQASAEQAGGSGKSPPLVTRSGKKGVTLALSGQVNRVSFHGDDGTSSEVFHSDNDNSSTRWRLVGKGVINDQWTVGTKIEQDIGQTNNSSTVNFFTPDTSVTDVSFDNRHLMFYVQNKTFGRVSLGKTDTASNNIVQIDQSGTTVIEHSGLPDVGGGMAFRVDGTGAVGPTVGGVYSQLDGLSRRNLFRYDTPKIFGFTASTSHVQGDAWDVALRYSANYKALGLKVAAGMAYWSLGLRSTTIDNGYGGSISVLHDSGLNLTFSAATEEREPGSALDVAGVDDRFTFFVKPGWKFKMFPIGKTAISAHYAESHDFLAQDDEFSSWGFAVVQNIDKVATEVFAFFRQYDLDRTGTGFDDINLFGVGGRVKF
jgi:predicted porin